MTVYFSDGAYFENYEEFERVYNFENEFFGMVAEERPPAKLRVPNRVSYILLADEVRTRMAVANHEHGFLVPPSLIHLYESLIALHSTLHR